MYVYVLDTSGHPLMPTQRFGKVKRMLDDGLAKVVRKEPFTIQLLYEPKTKVTQDVFLGVDTGSRYIGAAAYSEGRILYASEVEIRNDITKKMDDRRSCRRNRRYRKTRYRKPRFLNRKNSTKKDRFNPTMVSKINSHVREIEFIKSILPINKKASEKAIFDPHLLKMQEEGKPFNRYWGYLKGPNYGFANAKAACLNRGNYTCQYCKTKKGTLNVHHIVFKRDGGADTIDNFIVLCEKCHKALHAGKLKNFEKKLKGRRKGRLKHATQMNSVRKQLFIIYPDMMETYGFITKENRQLLGLPKAHFIDACVIASGGKPFEMPDYYYKKKHVSKGDYQLTKGNRGEIKIPTGKIKGFRKFNKVNYLGEECFIKGRMSTGYAFLMDIDGNTIKFDDAPRGCKTPKMANLIKVSARSTTLCTKVKTMLNTI